MSLAISITKSPNFLEICKHIDFRYHLIHDLIKFKEIELLYIRGEDQTAEIFTETLENDVFVKFRKLLGMCLMEELI